MSTTPDAGLTIDPATDAHWFSCHHCGYETRDAFTVSVINDLSGCCPSCESDDIGPADFPMR